MPPLNKIGKRGQRMGKEGDHDLMEKLIIGLFVAPGSTSFVYVGVMHSSLQHWLALGKG